MIDLMEIEDYLNEQGVFKSGLDGRPAHSDSYMTVVDFENLEKALLNDSFDWRVFALETLDNTNTQPPLKIVSRAILSRFPERLYNVIVINNKTKMKVRMNRTPMSHKKACTFLSKITKYDWRTDRLEEVTK